MILDTFYFLFKSDSKDVEKGIDDLEKKISLLTDKGKKRSEQENKDLKEAIKQHKELNQQLDNTNSQYTKVAESVAQAVTAAISFGTLAKGIFNTAENNSALEVQSRLIGQSTIDLKAYGAAAEAAGGSAVESRGFIQSLFQSFAGQAPGAKLGSIREVFDSIRQQLKIVGNDLSLRENIFQKFNVPQGVKPLLSLSDEEYERAIKKQLELARNTEEGAKIARQFEESWSNVGSALNSVFTSLGTDILPEFQLFNIEIVKFLDNLRNNLPTTERDLKNLGEGLVIVGGLIVASFVPALLSMAAAGATATAALAPLIALVDVYNNGHDSFLGKQSRKVANAIDGFIHGDSGFLNNAPSTQIRKESYKSYSEPLSGSPDIAAQIALRHGQEALGIASQTNLGSYSNSIVNGGKNVSVKTGDINVYTSSSTSQGIAGDISNDLSSHLRTAISNLDDGVNY